MKIKYENREISSQEITKAIWTIFDGKDRGVESNVLDYVRPFYNFAADDLHSLEESDGNYFVSRVFYEIKKVTFPRRKSYFLLTFKKSDRKVSYDHQNLIFLDNKNVNLGITEKYLYKIGLDEPYENEKIRIEKIVVLTKHEVLMKQLFIAIASEEIADVRISSAAEIFAGSIYIKYAQGFNLLGKRVASIPEVIELLKSQIKV